MAVFRIWRIFREAYCSNGNDKGFSESHKATRLTVKARNENEARSKMRKLLNSMKITGFFSVQQDI